MSRRAREIGIRMALGARGQQVVWNVAREVAVLVGVGTGVGLTLSLMLMLVLRVMAAPAPGVAIHRPSPDPVALLAIMIFMIVVGLAGRGAARSARRDDGPAQGAPPRLIRQSQCQPRSGPRKAIAHDHTGGTGHRSHGGNGTLITRGQRG